LAEHTSATVQSYITNYGKGYSGKNAQLVGPNALIGINDYIFVNETTILFGLTPAPGKRQIDVTEGKIPAEKYLIDYTANPAGCCRCGGTGIVRDINIDNVGKAVYVTGKSKIKQRIIKCLLTTLGTSPYDVRFGSELQNLVGQSITDEIKITLQKTIVQAVTYLIQNQPAEYEDAEAIDCIKGITIGTLNGADAIGSETVLLVKVVVISRAGETIDCSIDFNLE
jgi:hypothetical protein